MRISLLLGASLFVPRLLSAQDGWRPAAVEVRPFAGMFFPTGAQRADFKSATMIGIQGAMEFNRHVHVVGGVGRTHGHTKLFARDGTNIWQYDLGAEFNLIRQIGVDWDVRPFVGAGGGGRTYEYRSPGVGTRTCHAGYATVGAELQRELVALRAEARDYLSCFDSPLTRAKRTRNDLGLTVGVAYHVR